MPRLFSLLAPGTEQQFLSYRNPSKRAAAHPATTLRRIGTIYRCHRRSEKNAIETLLDIAGKRWLNKSLYSSLLKFFIARNHRWTARDLNTLLDGSVSLEQVLTREKLSGATFFFEGTDCSVWTDYRTRFPHQSRTVIEQADRIARHEFDLLGSGPRSWGEFIDWHLDPKSGARWPKKFYVELFPLSSLTNNVDVKLPYELSRMQHLPTLGKAYRITGNELYARELVNQIAHWLDDNPYLIGVNWTCAMDVAIRIINILWGLAFIEGSGFITRPFKERMLLSIWQHGQYLVRHLEFSIRQDGTVSNHNHYLSNLVGLVYLGILFPEFRASQTWRHIGLTGLVEEMDRQVYPDGVDYESSTSYHRLVLELFTSAAVLCRLNDLELPKRFWQRLEKMYSFSLHVIRPDGNMPQVGDADDGRLHILSDYGHWNRTDHGYLLSIGAALFRRSDMKARAGAFCEDAFWLLGREGANRFDNLRSSRTSLGSKAFPEAGFYIMRSGEDYLLACCNPVGTGGAGNHKHNDLLSFELCIGGQAFIVDPGTYVYTAAPEWRRVFRSTRYHNTVVVDGEEQNRFKKNTVFSIFPDTEPIVHEWRTSRECDRLEAEHTGYRRLPNSVSHRRWFLLDKQKRRIEITDILHGRGKHRAEWNFHYDHGVEVERAGETEFLAHSGGVTLRMTVISTVAVEAGFEEGWVSRSYGKKLPATILKLQGTFSDQCRLVFRASTLDATDQNG